MNRIRDARDEAPQEAFAKLLERVVQFWERAGLGPRPGVAPADLVAFETSHRVSLPGELQEYFLRVNGNVGCEGCVDEIESMPFWPLEKMIADSGSVFDHREHPQHFVLAEYFLGSYFFAVRLGSEQFGEIVLLSGGVPRRVAWTFGEFLTKCLDSPGQLLRPQPE